MAKKLTKEEKKERAALRTRKRKMKLAAKLLLAAVAAKTRRGVKWNDLDLSGASYSPGGYLRLGKTDVKVEFVWPVEGWGWNRRSITEGVRVYVGDYGSKKWRRETKDGIRAIDYDFLAAHALAEAKDREARDQLSSERSRAYDAADKLIKKIPIPRWGNVSVETEYDSDTPLKFRIKLPVEKGVAFGKGLAKLCEKLGIPITEEPDPDEEDDDDY
jgi:hypothetical protein